MKKYFCQPCPTLWVPRIHLNACHSGCFKTDAAKSFGRTHTPGFVNNVRKMDFLMMPRSLDDGNDVDVIEQVHYFCMLWCARPRREISLGASCEVACLKFSPTFTPWIRLILFSLAQMSEFCHRGVHQPARYRPAPSANGRNIKNLHFPPLISIFVSPISNFTSGKHEKQSFVEEKCIFYCNFASTSLGDRVVW